MGRVPLFALKVEVPEEEGSENDLEELEKSDLKFSAGNPRIERVSGTVRLFAQRPSSDSNDIAPHDLPRELPPGRGSTVCVLAVPPRMSASEFCSFVGAILSQVEELRFLRDASPSSTSSAFLALLKFSSQDAADSFHAFYHGKRFHSLQPDLCSVLFVSHIAIEHSSNAPPLPDSLSEVPSCPVCLERLDESSGGVVTTVCSHSFHSSCLVQWNDASCPVCRYCHSPPEPPQCTICGSTEDVWICLICGSVGCGRYSHAHAKEHWLQTSHCYSMELPTKRVWDYVGDTYVHRLLQSKAGQFVEVEPDNDDTAATTAFGNERDTCGGASSSISGTSKWQQAVLSSKTDAIAWEYNQLLTSQLESQRQYFEGTCEFNLFATLFVALLLIIAIAGCRAPTGNAAVVAT
jgi:BRCA1-associated protein